ncbi:glutathione peroxidase [Aestuariivirga sp.]|uniref:glutathione peroxidase n=1 Tax=Aestuariivirga sp. TaxID=2650926 RepID=UPI0039E2D065
MTTAYDFSFTAIDGAPLPLSSFRGKVLLVVNTASECGFTPQYEGLEQLWQARKGQGLVVLGVPCNDFGAQEPGTSGEIAQFCKVNYGVTFPLTTRSVVKGAEAHPFYKWAGEQAGLIGRPKWNFHKYLIGRQGEFITWFSSVAKPTGPKIGKALDQALATS